MLCSLDAADCSGFRASRFFVVLMGAGVSFAVCGFAAAVPANTAALALDGVPAEQRGALKFLIDNMPERDRGTLTREFLLENLALAYQARQSSAWGRSIPETIFLNAVLPYASVNERRDNWRKDFLARFGPLVKDCTGASEAALILNAKIFKELNVQYHGSKRPKADQSPYESIEAGFASCSGLSILLIDACRAVGVPARFVGTPNWTTGKGDANGNHGGNHSWVEIWDGQWHVLGAIEVSPLDKTWFLGNASKADPTRAENCIYASSFAKTGLSFPLVWDPAIRYVPAEDVTQSYLQRVPVTIEVHDHIGGTPAPAHLALFWKNQLVADLDSNGAATLILSAGQTYRATLSRTGYDGGAFTFTAPAESGRTLTFVLSGP